jgi:hypothetical protein
MPQATLYAAPLPFQHDGQQSIHRVLVSNRGEIAVRIIESCHRLGLETVAVFTDMYVPPLPRPRECNTADDVWWTTEMLKHLT